MSVLTNVWCRTSLVSNSVWAFASAGLRGQGQINLIAGVADTLDHNNGAIVQDFKPQELSNTAWGVATLMGKRGSEPSLNDEVEDDAALRILRWVATSLEERVDEFKPQEGKTALLLYLFYDIELGSHVHTH